MSNGTNESFVRWQGLMIAQFTQATSVILGLAVAALGFDAALLTNEKFLPASWQKCAFVLAVIALLISVGAGIWCVINRLRDFRATTSIARDRGSSDAETIRTLANDLGKFSWVLLWWQIGAFGAGILGTIVVVAAVYGGKLL